MAKKEKHKKGKKRKKADVADSSPHQLILDAALGDRRSCKAFIKAGADADYADADGNTALHEACRHGHLDIVKLLLKNDALVNVCDRRGDTPAHLAARHRHLDVLAELLKSRPPPDIDRPNRLGVTVRQLAAAAMSAPQQAQHAPHRQQGSPDPGLEQFAPRGAEARGEEDSWRERLRQELSDGEAPGWEEGEDGACWGAADEYETAEEYAERIWQEMRARRQAQRDAEMAAFRRRRRDEQSRRDWARKQAEEASRRILEEERKKDSAWRQAVAQGKAGAKRASYEARWEFFATKNTSAAVGYAQVPWIVTQEGAPPQELKNVVLYGASTPEEKKRRLRSELVRWHPDKFVAKFGSRLVEGDKGRVLERVKEISQLLNSLNAELQQRD